MEKKSFNFTLKAVDDSTDEKFYTIEGIASDNTLDRIEDIVVADAVAKSIEKFGMPKFFYQHNMSDPIGIWKEITQIGNETHVKAQLPKGFEDIDKIVALVKMGALGGFSIGFNIIDSEWKDSIRIIKEIEVLEISLVSIPCNSNAIITEVKNNKIEVKKMFDEAKTLADIEKVLESKGFSQSESKQAISKISEIKEVQRDAEALEVEEQKAQRDAEELKESLGGLTKSLENYNNKLKEA